MNLIRVNIISFKVFLTSRGRPWHKSYLYKYIYHMVGANSELDLKYFLYEENAPTIL